MVLFCFKSIQQVDTTYKINEIANKFLLARDKLFPEMHLRQPGFLYSACGRFTKNKERIKKFKETGDSRYIYQNESDKTCFEHDITYKDFKDLNRKTFADKVLGDKAFNAAKDTKDDEYQGSLVSIVYKFFNEKSGSIIKNKNISNKEFTEELHKPIIRKYHKRVSFYWQTLGCIFSRYAIKK